MVCLRGAHVTTFGGFSSVDSICDFSDFHLFFLGTWRVLLLSCLQWQRSDLSSFFVVHLFLSRAKLFISLHKGQFLNNTHSVFDKCASLEGSLLRILVQCLVLESGRFIHKDFSAALLIWGTRCNFLFFLLVSWSHGNPAITKGKKGSFFFLPFFLDLFPFPNLLHLCGIYIDV